MNRYTQAYQRIGATSTGLVMVALPPNRFSSANLNPYPSEKRSSRLTTITFRRCLMNPSSSIAAQTAVGRDPMTQVIRHAPRRVKGGNDKGERHRLNPRHDAGSAS